MRDFNVNYVGLYKAEATIGARLIKACPASVLHRRSFFGLVFYALGDFTSTGNQAGAMIDFFSAPTAVFLILLCVFGVERI